MANPWRHTEREVFQAIKKLGCASAHMIAAHMGLKAHKWVARKIIILREAKKIYVSDYKRHHKTGPAREYYSIVKSPEDVDVPKPKPLTNAQKSLHRYYRNRQKEFNANFFS